MGNTSQWMGENLILRSNDKFTPSKNEDLAQKLTLRASKRIETPVKLVLSPLK